MVKDGLLANACKSIGYGKAEGRVPDGVDTGVSLCSLKPVE